MSINGGGRRTITGLRHGNMGGMGEPVGKAKDFEGSLKRLLTYLRPHKIHLVVVAILAIMSTCFSIAAPKVMSKAINKLQNAYMASRMLSELSKAQNRAVEQMNNKMGDIQEQAVDKIIIKMADSQRSVINRISISMGNTQVKAVEEIYIGVANKIYQGALSGQKFVVDKITSQMAATQKTMVAKVRQQMAQTQSVNISNSTMAIFQRMLELPTINTGAYRETKIKNTLQFIDVLGKMPGYMYNDKDSLTTIKKILSIPMIESINSGSEKVSSIRQLIDTINTMPSLGIVLQPPIELDSLKMEEVYKRMQTIDSLTDSNTIFSNEINQNVKDTVLKLANLPSINDIQDVEQKREILLQLIDIFRDIMDMPIASILISEGTMDKTNLQSMRDLAAIPDVSATKNSQQGLANVIGLIDVFDKMSKSDNALRTEIMKPEQLGILKELLSLPMLETISNVDEKTKITRQMLNIFGSMPDIGNITGNTVLASQMSIWTMKSVKDFLDLPKLESLTDAGQKADVCKKITDLSSVFAKLMSGVIPNTRDTVKFTDAQIKDVIEAIKETNGKYDFNYIGMISLWLIAMYGISALFSLIMGLVMSGVSQKTVRDLREELDDKLAKLPLKYYDMHPHGDILSRVTNDIDTIASTLQQSLTQVITSVITIIGYAIMMFSISTILALILLATLPGYLMVTTIIAKKSQKYFAFQQNEIGLLSGHIEEMYTGHKIVKVFGCEQKVIADFEEINSRLRNVGWKAQFVSGIIFPLVNFISNLGYVGICMVGGIWITRSLLGLGDILAFIQYSRSLTMPIVQTANIANIIQSTIACAERVFEIIDEEEEIPDSFDTVMIEEPKGEVVFEHVDFSYTYDFSLIEDMNIRAEPGHTVAIVGPTGAGKTTLVNLLMRFYEINAGKIKIDGVDIRNIPRSELRKMFGMVLQDTWLYNATIKENIAYAKEEATMEEIIRAAKMAHADHFIRTLPEGYNTILNEEATNISQGQKQLLTIARAILANPTVLILDEATSSVDTRTEVMIQKAMANLMKDRTSFVIAHRLSTIHDAEIILVMSKGKIIEMGNHKELLSQKGFYAELYNSQFSATDLENENM